MCLDLATLAISVIGVLCPGDGDRHTLVARDGRLTSVRVQHGRLAFETIEDYEQAVSISDREDEEELVEMVRSLDGFTPASCSSAAAEIEDPLLATILNQDQVVQIGDYIIRINPATERLFVLPASLEAHYADLVAEETTGGQIAVFSASADVLAILREREELASGLNGVWSWFAKSFKGGCTETGVGKREASTDIILPGVIELNGQLHYNKYGILFSLKADLFIWYGFGWEGFYVPYIDFEPVYYHARCGTTAGPYNKYDYTDGNAYHIEYQSYKGSKPLNQLDMRAKFKAVPPFPYVNFESQWIEIRANY